MVLVVKDLVGGFGDELVTAMFAQILIDNGVDAKLWSGSMELTTVPHYVPDGKPHITIPAGYNYIGPDGMPSDPYPGCGPMKPIKMSQIEQNIYRFNRLFDSRPIRITRNHVPVLFYDLPNTPVVDVAINSKTYSYNTKYWPYWDELKKKLTENGIRWLALDDLHNVKLLNVVQKAKLYLGLETGISHYVSQVANGKALIIQGGWVGREFWAKHYDYEFITHDTPCGWCCIAKSSDCPYRMQCLHHITVDQVFDAVVRKLES